MAKPERKEVSELSLRERNKQEKVRRIRKAALELFEERGYEATTTKEIARRAEISEGTLFAYAETKGDILGLAMVSELLDILDRARNTLPADKPFPDKVAHIYIQYLRYHARLKDLSRFFMRETVIGPTPVRAAEGRRLVDRTIEAVEEIASAEQQAGTIRSSISANRLSWTVWALFHGVYHRFLRDDIATVQRCASELRDAYRMLYEGLRER